MGIIVYDVVFVQLCGRQIHMCLLNVRDPVPCMVCSSLFLFYLPLISLPSYLFATKEYWEPNFNFPWASSYSLYFVDGSIMWLYLRRCNPLMTWPSLCYRCLWVYPNDWNTVSQWSTSAPLHLTAHKTRLCSSWPLFEFIFMTFFFFFDRLT